MLSIMPKIPEISVGIQMERFVSVFSDQNIRDYLWRWSTRFGRNRPIFAVLFSTNRFFALRQEVISENNLKILIIKNIKISIFSASQLDVLQRCISTGFCVL